MAKPLKAACTALIAVVCGLFLMKTAKKQNLYTRKDDSNEESK